MTIDEHNCVTFYNKAAEALWGYTADEVVGKNVAMLVPAAIRSDHDNLVNANRTTGIDKIVGTNREVEVHRKDGEVLWGSLSLSKVEIGGKILYTAFVKDVTEQVLSRETFKRLSLVANETDNSVIITDPEGFIEYVNPGFTRMTGYSEAEVLGKKPGSFLQGPETDPDAVRRIGEALAAREAFYEEILNYTKDGESYWISLAINPVFTEDGNVDKFISIQANIDATKLAALEYNYKLEAIDRTNVVVEMDLDGSIQRVNQNFLQSFSMQSDQTLLGQRFDTLFADASEHAQLWANLAAKQSAAGEYEMADQTGRSVWLAGSFNPIVNLQGDVVKVAFYGNDVTARTQEQQTIEQVLGESRRVMEAIAQGDLTQQVEGEYTDEFERLQTAINDCNQRLMELVGNIHSSSRSINENSSSVASGNSDLSHRTEEQATSLQETSASMDQMTETVRTNAENSKRADQLAEAARTKAAAGGGVVADAVNAMNEIYASSKQISDIIGVIDEIAFQTNLLALNAAVEAARAGEQGRGFAVVASEVRNLAQRSAESAKEIKALINDSVVKVEEGSRLVNDSGDMLNEIVDSVGEVSDLITQIAQASEEQATGIEEVNVAVTKMEQMTQQNAALCEEVAASSEDMSKDAYSLIQLIDFFSVEKPGGQPELPVTPVVPLDDNLFDDQLGTPNPQPVSDSPDDWLEF